MTTMHEEQSKTAPRPLALVQALVNTQYGQGRRAHVELTSPEQLRAWLVAHSLLTDGMPVTEGDFRRVLLLREALRSLLRANHETAMLASPIDVFNRLASDAPLTVRLHSHGLPTLEPDIAGVDGALARLVGMVFTAMTDGTWARLKACRNERCQKAFYDTSKNRSGAWCSMAGCGSRLKAVDKNHETRLSPWERDGIRLTCRPTKEDSMTTFQADRVDFSGRVQFSTPRREPPPAEPGQEKR